jgi:hypothetical protein
MVNRRPAGGADFAVLVRFFFVDSRRMLGFLFFQRVCDFHARLIGISNGLTRREIQSCRQPPDEGRKAGQAGRHKRPVRSFTGRKQSDRCCR